MADDADTQGAAKGASKPTRGTVAKGRTVLAPTKERRVAGYGAEGKPIYRTVDKAYGPGQEVTLPEEEILHLRRTGFLIDPDAEAPNYGDGPVYART